MMGTQSLRNQYRIVGSMTTNRIINNWEHLLKEAESEKGKKVLY